MEQSERTSHYRRGDKAGALHSRLGNNLLEGSDTLLLPGKWSCSGSLTKTGSNSVPNRVHCRVIVCDYEKAIYKVSSRAALLETVDGYIEGDKSLYTKASILQRDILINNLVMIKDNDNPS
jgi:Fungal protein kinase